MADIDIERGDSVNSAVPKVISDTIVVSRQTAPLPILEPKVSSNSIASSKSSEHKIQDDLHLSEPSYGRANVSYL